MLNRLSKSVTVLEKSFYIITCSISSGSSPVRFKWHFNDKPIVAAADYQIENNERFSLLKLIQVNQAHTGNYTCVASNQLGFDSTHLYLIVQGYLTLLSIIKIFKVFWGGICVYCQNVALNLLIFGTLFFEILYSHSFIYKYHLFQPI